MCLFTHTEDHCIHAECSIVKSIIDANIDVIRKYGPEFVSPLKIQNEPPLEVEMEQFQEQEMQEEERKISNADRPVSSDNLEETVRNLQEEVARIRQAQNQMLAILKTLVHKS